MTKPKSCHLPQELWLVTPPVHLLIRGGAWQAFTRHITSMI